MPDGSAYENTKECEAVLLTSALDARYLELVSADDFNDRRSVEPIINDTEVAEDAVIGITGGLTEYKLPDFEIPKLEVWPPKIFSKIISKYSSRKARDECWGRCARSTASIFSRARASSLTQDACK